MVTAKNQRDKTQAEQVGSSDQSESRKHSTGSRQRIAWPVIFALLFVGVLVASALFGRISWLVIIVYGVMSIATFTVYGWDKASAKLGRWRTPESTLHILGLICGWPGGLAAQQLIRHKSSKREFLTVFWVTVALNIAAVSYLIWSGENGIINQGMNKIWQLFT